MFIGHLPAAYLLGRTVNRCLSVKNSAPRYTVLAAMTGGILPDFDLVYFYTLGARQTVHHGYWSHIPVYWLVAYIILALIALVLRRIGAFKLLSVFFAAIALHLTLDTITGQIQWIYPLSAKAYTLVYVPAVHGWWVANFLLHWTFAIELFITTLAAILYVKHRSAKQKIH